MGFRLYDYLKTLSIEELSLLLVVSVGILILIGVVFFIVKFTKNKRRK